jgi:hypothetical protein
MPFMILYGGELVFAFLGLRIARWMWRSRETVLALWRARHDVPHGGPGFEPDPVAARAAPSKLRGAPRGARGRELAPSRRAA